MRMPCGGRAIMIVLAVLVALWGTPLQSQTVESYYRGRTLSLVISFAPGGLNDYAGRLVARHLGRFVPGQPTIIAQNMGGAGGLVAANNLYNVAARDGSVLGQLDRSVAQSGLRGAANVKFDPLRFTWLGSLSTYRDEAYVVWLNSAHAVTSLAQLAKASEPVKIGVVTGGTNNQIAKIARDVLGLNIQIIAGYPGGAALWLAFLKGEIDGQPLGITSVKVERPELWASRAVRGLVAFGTTERLPALPDVPTARELVASDAMRRDLVEFAELPFFTSQPFVMPPDVPAARAQALQRAFMSMVGDPEFIAEAARMRVELSPTDAECIMDRLKAAAAMPREVVAAFNRIVDAQ